MLSLTANVEILFGIAVAFAFLFPLIKDGIYKKLSIRPLADGLGGFVLVIVPFAALFCFAGFLGASIEMTLPCFAGAAALSYVLTRSGLTPFLRGVFLLGASFLLTMFIPQDGGNLAISSAILGLLIVKVADSVLLGGERGLDDIIAPLSWLGGVLWLTTLEDQGGVPMKQAILLGVISVCLLMRIIERPFMTDDRWLVKRVVLATTGGLGVLLVITKLLLAMDQAPLAALAGGGMLAAYLFQNIEVTTQDENASYGTSGIKLLIVIGMLTLIATRFWGMFGLVVLAPTALIAPRFSLAQFGGLFFAVRALLQVFIVNYNPNVTGINIMHAYTGAAEYAGIIIMAALALLIRDVKDRRLLAALFLGAAAAVPMLSNYYLHAEPTSSLLVAGAVGGIIFSVLGPAFHGNADGATAPCESLLLLPAMMASVGITYSGLIDAGNGATSEYKTTILTYVIGAAVVCFIVGYFATRKDATPPLNGDKPPATTSV